MTSPHPLCRSATSLVLTAGVLALGACASSPRQGSSPLDAVTPSPPLAAGPARSSPDTGSGTGLPRYQSLAPLASALSRFEKGGADHFAVLQKATFTYQEQAGAAATMTLLSADLDPLALDTGVPRGTCTRYGAPLNEQTVDYPYAAVLTRAAALVSVTAAHHKPMRLRALGDNSVPNQSVFSGLGKRNVEFGYDRCVGALKADTPGHRLDTYLPNGAQIELRPATGPGTLRLQLNDRFAPFILLRHADGRQSAAPSRIVLVDIDAQARRVHVHYRTLFRAHPGIRDIELRAVVPESMGGAAGEGETPQAFHKRSTAMLAHLARCERRTGYSEPCADVGRAVTAGALR